MDLLTIWRIVVLLAACLLIVYTEATGSGCRLCSPAGDVRYSALIGSGIITAGFVFALSDPFGFTVAVIAPVVIWLLHNIVHSGE